MKGMDGCAAGLRGEAAPRVNSGQLQCTVARRLAGSVGWPAATGGGAYEGGLRPRVVGPTRVAYGHGWWGLRGWPAATGGGAYEGGLRPRVAESY